MEKPYVSNFNEFHELVQKYDYNIDIFRGVNKEEYELITKFGRINKFNYPDWSR